MAANTLDLILLVDDDETTNFLNQRMLKRMNVAREIKIVTHGEEAISFLKNACQQNETCPNLIFLDIKMPVMDGFEFLDEYETLKQDLPHIPAIMMLTSSASFYDLERLKNYPDVLRHYSKPLSETDVRELLQEYFPN
jgi:CheY-like chemotaxis protein